MNDIIQNLKADCYSGKDTFYLISENKLNALKELSKREEQEKNNLEQALDEIEKYIEYNCFYAHIDDDVVSSKILDNEKIDNILEIIKKAKGE